MHELLDPPAYSLVQDHMPFRLPESTAGADDTASDVSATSDRDSVNDGSDSDEEHKVGLQAGLAIAFRAKMALSRARAKLREGKDTREAVTGSVMATPRSTVASDDDGSTDAKLGEVAADMLADVGHRLGHGVEKVGHQVGGVARAAAAAIKEVSAGPMMDAHDDSMMADFEETAPPDRAYEMPRSVHNRMWMMAARPFLLMQGLFYFAWSITGWLWIASSDTCSTTSPGLFYTCVVDATPVLISFLFCAWDWFDN